MGDIFGYIVVAALMVLLVMALVSLLRSFLLGIRAGKGAVPPTRIVAVLRPEPVTVTPGVKVVAAAGVVWAGLHLAAVAVWASTGELVTPTFSTALVAVYVALAAALTGIGGILLLAARAIGRRVVAWGQFLLGVAAVLAIAIALMLPGYEDASVELRSWSGVLAACFAAHLVLDVVVGTAAQHAGKSKRSMDDTHSEDSTAS